ncbi:hypothetical protein D3C73_1181960 [compost metagenome]
MDNTKVKGMLVIATTSGNRWPQDGGIHSTSVWARASTIFVPEKIPAKTPAANTSRTTVMALPEWARMRSFWMSSCG